MPAAIAHAPEDTQTTIVRILPGPSALTEFEAARLLARLQQIDPAVTAVAAHYLYLLQLPESAQLNESRLHELLDLQGLEAGGGAALADIAAAQHLYIGPRMGTQSPWSSKATDILHNTGFTAVQRFERGRVIAIAGASDLNALAPALHDRMTESVFAEEAALRTLFTPREPKPLTHIDVLARGAAAIEEADRALGLSLAADEIAYLVAEFERLQRNPTDVELYMFAQANSEHCRHKIFNANWTVNGAKQPKSLFGMIRNTYEQSSEGVLSAYKDNAAVIVGSRGGRFFPDPLTRVYGAHEEDIHILCKVETHNHPTAISPFPGAATGSGGEIRDEGATGRGAKPKAGLGGFTVSNLNLPQAPQPWERKPSRPAHIASPLDIMIEGPLGAAAFNNEFGRPNLCGYFRTYEAEHNGTVFGYHKPIMLAGGLGNIRAEHVDKGAMKPGYALIALGGPAMLIGLGGGAASSSNSSNTELDFASVQRDNPEMERRAQEVIDRCWQQGEANPIAFIHDVGAGGLSNAFPELVKDGGDGRLGGTFDLAKVPRGEAGLSPLELWSNESQERYVLAVAPEKLAEFEAICERERCPFAVVGYATDEPRLVLTDSSSSTTPGSLSGPLALDPGPCPIDLPLQTLFGKPPKMERSFTRTSATTAPLDLSGIELEDAIARVLQMPSVASKSFLITIGDRTVGGLTVQDQMVGPWQVPVADCAVTMTAFGATTGEAMAIGERTPLAVTNAAASARMAVGEVITNLAGTAIGKLSDIKLSANWMAAASEPGQNEALYDAVHAVGMELCPALGMTIPVGKDSMSMRTAWNEDSEKKSVVAPLSLIVSGFAPVSDTRRTLTPQVLDDGSPLLLIDLGEGKNRLGGSALAQAYGLPSGDTPDTPEPAKLKAFFEIIQRLNNEGVLLAYHDRSDGGLLATLLEMAFASQCGFEINIGRDTLGALFSEELGAVIQIDREHIVPVLETFIGAGISASLIGVTDCNSTVSIFQGGNLLYTAERIGLHKLWASTSFHIQSLRDNPATAAEEFALLDDELRPGLFVDVPFDANENIAAPYLNLAKPRVAILREQGVNGQVEMGASFDRAGFEAVDVHMSDLLSGREDLARFQGLAACGGFSYGDVLGAGSGWARTILFNDKLAEMFATYFARPDTFSLGVCNGCQSLAQLRTIIPGAGHWPLFTRNVSARFEARLCMAEITATNSLFFEGMVGGRAPIVVSHGEGYAAAAPDATIAIRYIDTYGNATQHYPLNPNGSANAAAGFTSADGRALVLMPHPERIALGLNHSWTRSLTNSPWQRMFDNARKWVG
ncbi:phosphoribosylformylglycinamidine synthase [Bryocella elongata]|uniref:Phosphoribosylformylglycinamidine synthase n=1 Tax=Bryocella elongata TaxID=863522 RepID=A0A1H5YGT4_9BACT|nr:phosphoribosylformylglycinamidine synthase [Bryocella elongata]SEG22890.1 phosphoribosylformylglycinamidine synthase [Bryocella elongata]